ncbi:DUF6588 family protein [uncultured Acetobacteroides sp.]|uniref:DUF6588 family protein n=1 Tax=uncultured Acetobacteroides sp. TaxID=1760811 RepID=UPI0029F4DB0D|nr:DUF6588 family protein [uncultured Acetobacteroides sp.]
MRNMKKKLLLAVLALAFSVPSFAQTDIAELLKLYKDAQSDVTVLAKEYMRPFGEEFGKTLNTGWYTSAKPHKLGGFDITFSATAIPVSSSMKSFDLSKLELKELGHAAGATTPTVLGKDEDGATVFLKKLPSQTMKLPQGANIPVMPMVNYNIAVGLPFHTDVSVRFIPKISIGDDGKFGLWGIGLRNEFKEFIPVFKLLPFNMSAFWGMTKYNLSWDMANNSYADPNYSDQKLSTDATSYTARLLVSKSIPVLTVYGGIGYNSSSSNYKLKGHYQYNGIAVNGGNDPFNLDYTSTGMMFNAGLRVKLAVFMLFGDYTYAGTSMYTAGLGFTFR